MAFDKGLDKELFGESVEFEVTRLRVSVFAYNNGTPKLQISRENRLMDSGEWTFAKMGRLTKEELEKILPLINKAIPSMKKEE
ncbi:MAG: hypothetical protein WC758_02435 [Candidatus Woesearchaeota archaeon]|jgi:hypothetical protein